MATRRQILAELDRLEPRVRQAFRDAVERIRSRARLAELEEAIRANDLARAATAAGLGPASWAIITEAMRGVYVEGGIFQADQAPARLAFDFDMTNPRAERWLRQHSSEFVTLVTNEQREAIREAVGTGAAAGQNPRTTALDIVGRVNRATGRREGGIVGLTQQQSGAVTKARAALRSGDPEQMRYYLTLEKRDKRFDGRVKRAIAGTESLTEQDVNRITGRLSDRYLQLRGETIARTETITAFNTGANESLQQAVDQGLIRSAQRVWDAVGDARTRPTHMAANGQKRGLNEPFNIGGAQMMYPGDPAGGASNVIACRCVVRTTDVEWGEQ